MAEGQSSTSFGDLPVVVKVLLGFAVIAVVSAVYFFVFHAPLVADISSAKGEKTRLEDERTQAQQRQREFVELNDELARRQALDKQNRKVLPADAEIPAFLQDLHRLGELSGLDLKLVEPRPEEHVGGAGEEQAAASAEESAGAPLYVRIPVSVHLKGRYHQVAKFFYNVSQLDRAISMEDVQLKNPLFVGDEVMLDVHVMATTFRRADPAEGAALEGEQ